MYTSYRRRKWMPCWCIVVSTFLTWLVLYNEHLVYLWNSFNWPKNECGEARNPYKILLVADPQILGENTESWIARWDSDRYLSVTFELAVRHVKPSLIVFLGDLMDEGSVATNAQFSRYYQRFQRIFSIDKFKNKTLYLPGDNDIGGEDDDLVTNEKLNRFNNHFQQPDTFLAGRIVFLKVNHMLRAYPTVDLSESGVSIRIALSHLPMLDLPSRFMQRAIMRLRPKLILTAHDHKAMHFVGDLDTGERTFLEEMKTNLGDAGEGAPVVEGEASWRFLLRELVVNELIVPTCSYRMGTEAIGYASALIDTEEEVVCYNILWLPKRLFHLKMYLAVISLIGALVLIYLSFSLIRYYCKRSRKF